MLKQMTWEQAIEQVLAESPTALHYSEITERIINQGLRSSLGATPAATVAAVITSSIKRNGLNSPYVKAGKGLYALARSGVQPAIAQTKAFPTDLAATEDDEKEEQYAIVSSFGMFWRRELVEWVRNPRILGQQYGATSVVDFTKQCGVYLLYDGREVIYVGRVHDRGLGMRLSEHTWDRLST